MIAKSKKIEKTETLPKPRYFEGRGGRKSAIARVRLYIQKGGFTVNDKTLSDYFFNPSHQMIAKSPLSLMNVLDTTSASVKVHGGGIAAQAEAIRNGLARALVKFNEEFKKRLRKAGFMTRDARVVERKKPGLKKARKAPQWAKR